MGSKRDNSTLNDPIPEPPNKRRRDQGSKSKGAEPKPDATYGQRSAFGSLQQPTHPSDDDLEFEDEGDALAYLKSVRQEADGIPYLLTAPKAGPQLPPHLLGSDNDIDRSIYDDGAGDFRGYYEDGAYVAAPDTECSSDGEYNDYYHEEDPERKIREAYYTSLVEQFEVLRAQLHEVPPQHLVAALDKEHGTHVGHFGANSWTFRVWDNRIRYTDPLPVQVAAMDRRNALKLLRVILGGKFIRRGYELRERTSRWIWALLARLPDRGEMDYSEVGWVRELGKRAVLMMVSMTQMEALREEVEDDLEGEEVEEDDEGILNEVEIKSENGVSNTHEDPHPQSLTNDVSQPAADHPAHLAPPAEDISPDDNDGEMDMDIDDGEVSDISSASGDLQADIAAAKLRLLEQLEGAGLENHDPAESKGKGVADSADVDEQTGDDKDRAPANMRATLNMILTVAGEFYGQRDLLEFRNPFPTL